MKLEKIFATMLVLALLVTMFPTGIYAGETENVRMVEDEEMREFVIAKAIQAFPEYEKQIKGEVEINLSKSRSMIIDEIVVNETRYLSENETNAKKALVEYRGWFYYDMSDFGSVIPYADNRVLKIEVGDNTWTLSSSATSELENN